MCLGMHLARMETRVVLERLFDRLPNLRLDPNADPPMITGMTFRGPVGVARSVGLTSHRLTWRHPMQPEDLILVSVDDHVVEPPTLFDNHLPDKWKEFAPKNVHLDDRNIDVWMYEGDVIPNIGLNAVAGRPPEEYNVEPTSWST